MVKPSKATGTSMKPIPAASQRSTSESLIGREAFETSVSPAQNRLKPPPVPETPTVTRTPRPVRMPNSSAIAPVIGKTVEEPSTWISPVSVLSCRGAGDTCSA